MNHNLDSLQLLICDGVNIVGTTQWFEIIKVHEKKREEKREKTGLEERNLEVVITGGEQYDVI